MPHRKQFCLVEHKNNNSAECGKTIASEHGFLFVELVGNGSCKNAHKNIGGIGADC